MKVEDTPPVVPIPPPPRTTQEAQVRTVLTEDAEGRTKVKELHYVTTIYDYKGSLKEITRPWSKSYLV
jgi:hypothetical protein